MTQTIREQLQALVKDIKFIRNMNVMLDRRRILMELESILATPDPAVTVHGIQNEWMRAIGKAASALRFTANEWEGYTEAAKAELLKISEQLTELETHLINYRVPAVTVRKGWVCKDRCAVRWSSKQPEWAVRSELWITPAGSISVHVEDFLNDPWPDKPDGGPECCVEVG